MICLKKHGLGSFENLLIELSKDPAMIMWLDNQDNHKDNINENYGREILELFSMGVGNYSEEDIKECSRAFTGWTVENMPYMAIKMRNNTARPLDMLLGSLNSIRTIMILVKKSSWRKR